MAGLTDSGLMAASGFRTVTDPYTGREWAAIPAVQPDWAIIHVQAADADGDVRIRGPKYDDVLLAKAARNVLVTCEEVLPAAAFAALPEQTDLPGFLVTAVAHVPRGAAPGSCHGCYDWDEAYFRRYLSACGTPASYRAFLDEALAVGLAPGR